MWEIKYVFGSLLFIPSVLVDLVHLQLLQGDELRDFIKGFLSQIQNGELLLDSPSKDDNDQEDLDEYFWLKALRKCPKSLLDLVNSKACRGMYARYDSSTQIHPADYL